MIHANEPKEPGFAALIKGFLNTDPYQCILCGNRLQFMSAEKAYMRSLYCQKDGIKWLKSDGYKPQPRISVPIISVFG